MGAIAQLNQLSTVELLKASSRTANVNGTGLDITDYQGAVRLVQASGNITAGDNNSTYTFTIQDSADNSTYANVSGYPLTAASNQGTVVSVDIPTRVLRRYIRVQGNIAGGNSPAFPISVTLTGYKQVR